MNVAARLFDLQRGEGRRAGLLFGYLFLVITCYQLGKTARDALFLSVFKASKLPYADMAIAVLVGLVIAVYVTIGRRVGLRDLLVGCLLLFALLQCGFWYLAQISRSAEVAVSGLLHLGRDPGRARADTGVDAGQLPAHDPGGKARLRASRRGRHHGLDLFRHPRRPARDHARSRHREPAARDGDRSRGQRRAGRAAVAREGKAGRRRRAASTAGVEEPGARACRSSSLRRTWSRSPC